MQFVIFINKRDIMVIIMGNGHDDLSQIPDEADYIW